MKVEVEHAVNSAFFGMSIDTWQRLRMRIIGVLSDHVPNEDLPEVIEKIHYHGEQVSNIWDWEIDNRGKSLPTVWDRAHACKPRPKVP